MSVSNGWKSHFGENTKFGENTDMFNKYRSRIPKVVCKNDVLDNFAKFTRKYLCRSLLLKNYQATV